MLNVSNHWTSQLWCFIFHDLFNPNMRGLELFVNKPKILMWNNRRILVEADETESPETISTEQHRLAPLLMRALALQPRVILAFCQELARDRVTAENVDLNKRSIHETGALIMMLRFIFYKIQI